jgi:hypothetical protein
VDAPDIATVRMHLAAVLIAPNSTGAYSTALNYYDVTHPSQPNYIARTSGSTWGSAGRPHQRSTAPAGAAATVAGIQEQRHRREDGHLRPRTARRTALGGDRMDDALGDGS